MGTVDVDRYTGSCLITTAVRPKPKSQQQQQTQCKAVQDAQLATGVGPSSLPLDSAAASVGNKTATMMMTQDPRNWAGAPLLSMAASIRKTKQNGPNAGVHPGTSVSKSWHPHHPHHHQQHHLHSPVYLPAAILHHPHHQHPTEAFAASHLQGAPLIRLPRQQYKQQQQQQQVFQLNKRPAVLIQAQQLPHQHQQRPPGVRRPFALPIISPPPTGVIVAPRSSEDSRSAASSPSSTTSSSGGSSISDTCSITSDEGLASGGSESSLPRIIKSRRRHKKKKQQLQPQSKSSTTTTPPTTKQQQQSHESCALAELDQLTELFRSCASLSTTTTPSTPQQPSPLCFTPPLWPQQGDIWSSPPSCTSTSSITSASSSSSSCWPDQRVIRRPNRAFINTNALAEVSHSPDLHDQEQYQQHQQAVSAQQLHVSSQLIASPFNGHRDIEIRFFSSGSGGSDLADSKQLIPR